MALAATPDRAAWSLALDLLARHPEHIAGLPEFVAGVLLGRWATPRQRATITQRIETTPGMYQQVILEVARRGYPVQREWALRLLIEMASNGVAVPGFELIGLAEVGR
jgi:hypothetical protein